MDTLKIIKLQEGVFKHVVDNVEDRAFYNTEFSKMSIDNGTISINSGTFNRDFYISRIEIFDINSVNPLPISSVDDFVIKLNYLGYPVLNKKSIASSSGGTGSSASTTSSITTLYSVTTDFTGASVNDMIANTQVVDNVTKGITGSYSLCSCRRKRCY